MKKAKIILIAASAAMLLTGCMSREETEALSAWTVERYTAQAMAVQQRASWREKPEDTQADKPEIVKMAEPAAAPVSEPIEEQAGSEPEEAEPRESEQQEPLPVMEMVSHQAVYEPSPTPAAKTENNPAPSEPTTIPKIDWPYPQITCPPEPTSAPKIDWPYPAITCPPEPTPTPQPEWPESPVPSDPEPTPAPTPEPAEPDPAPAPTTEPGPVETPPVIPEPTPTPSGGYAVCSCGATLTPDELVSHMKAHAMNGENHSYVAY